MSQKGNKNIDLRFSIPRRDREPGAASSPAAPPPGGKTAFIPTPVVSRRVESGGTDGSVAPPEPVPPVKASSRPARRPGKRLFLFALAAGALLGLPFLFLHLGEKRAEARAKIKPERVPGAPAVLPPQLSRELDGLMKDLQEGNFSQALPRMREWKKSHPDVPGLSYLTAVAALQAGETGLAEIEVAESLRKKERVSDSLALQAVLETLKADGLTLLDPRTKAVQMLQQAVAADVGNPTPLLGLARLARSKGDTEEAVRWLTAARHRLQPVDSTTAVDVSIALTKLQALPDDRLPTGLPASNNVVNVFEDAYIAMRRGNFSRAAELLRLSREQLPADVFNYLLHDPAIRRYAGEARLAEFFPR